MQSEPSQETSNAELTLVQRRRSSLFVVASTSDAGAPCDEKNRYM